MALVAMASILDCISHLFFNESFRRPLAEFGHFDFCLCLSHSANAISLGFGLSHSDGLPRVEMPANGIGDLFNQQSRRP